MNFNVPILFLVFNRLDTTQQVFAEIKKQKPKYLYLASDGPRKAKSGETELVQKLRDSILAQIDWPCEVKTLFRETNLGCGKAVSSAITWFFENVEEGIVLEDDCLPNDDFFVFCSEMLAKYRNDQDVMSIAGSNFLKGNKRGDASYYFSSHFHVWGWASWRRAWAKYDFKPEYMQEKELKTILNKRFMTSGEKKMIEQMFIDMKTSKVDTWDYQWFFAHLFNNGLVAVPNANLITNIGFLGTHFADHGKNNNRMNLPTENLGSIVLAKNKVLDKEADRLVYELNFKFSNRFNPALFLIRSLKFITPKFIKTKIRSFNHIFDVFYLSIIRNIDGELGNKLRYFYYKNRLKFLGEGALINTGVFMSGLEYISIGPGSHIDRNCILVASSSSLDLSARIVKERRIKNDKVQRGELFIGKDCHIAQYSMIYAYGGVYIGDLCGLSTGVKIYSLTSLPNNPYNKAQRISIMPLSGQSPSMIGSVIIEANVWLGINVIIMPGVSIGVDSFIRSNAVVINSFGENSFISGDPAKYVKKRFELKEGSL